MLCMHFGSIKQLSTSNYRVILCACRHNPIINRLGNTIDWREKEEEQRDCISIPLHPHLGSKDTQRGRGTGCVGLVQSRQNIFLSVERTIETQVQHGKCTDSILTCFIYILMGYIQQRRETESVLLFVSLSLAVRSATLYGSYR